MAEVVLSVPHTLQLLHSRHYIIVLEGLGHDVLLLVELAKHLSNEYTGMLISVAIIFARHHDKITLCYIREIGHYLLNASICPTTGTESLKRYMPAKNSTCQSCLVLECNRRLV
jgi:hypothetical protein